MSEQQNHMGGRMLSPPPQYHQPIYPHMGGEGGEEKRLLFIFFLGIFACIFLLISLLNQSIPPLLSILSQASQLSQH